MEGTVRPSYWDPLDNTYDAEQAQETASKYGGILSARPVCIFGFALTLTGQGCNKGGATRL